MNIRIILATHNLGTIMQETFSTGSKEASPIP